MFQAYPKTAAVETNCVPSADTLDALSYAGSSNAGPVGATNIPLAALSTPHWELAKAKTSATFLPV